MNMQLLVFYVQSSLKKPCGANIIKVQVEVGHDRIRIDKNKQVTDVCY